MQKKKNSKLNNKKLATKKEFKLPSIIISLSITIFLIILISVISLFFGLNGNGFANRLMGMNFLIPKILISTVGTILLIYLLTNYISIYKEIKSKFTIGLITVSIVLLLETLISNPLLLIIIGIKGPVVADFLGFVSSIFVLIATIILIYLQKE
ncbi:MAG: hypothetical protein PHQ98_04120 [Candidatus ainarchaeum sp.]|nr:hypothetical protein [Candidatus ainarchaeum sp.]